MSGFPNIQYRRDLPVRGFSGYAMFAAGAAVMIGGFIVMGMQNRHTRAIKQETRRRRLAISSLLQAEEDRLYVRQLFGDLEREAELMKGHDWEVGKSSYNTRYMMPQNVVRING